MLGLSGALLLAASPIQYVNLLDLSDCPYSRVLAAMTRICVTLPLQIADLGKMSHFVSFRQKNLLATLHLHERANRQQSIPMFLKS